MNAIANTLKIFAMFIQAVSPIPIDTPIKRSINDLNSHIPPPHPPITQTLDTPTNYQPKTMHTPQIPTTILLLHIWIIQTTYIISPGSLEM